jgi:hypothetical protein
MHPGIIMTITTKEKAGNDECPHHMIQHTSRTIVWHNQSGGTTTTTTQPHRKEPTIAKEIEQRGK